MDTLFCIIVYNRPENIKRWLSDWQQCEQHGTKICIIRNFDRHTKQYDNQFQEIIHEYNPDFYIQRPNIGLDIGALQDVFKDRIKTFQWKQLMWCVDDTIPLHKNFLGIYLEGMKTNIGVVAGELSNECALHIRTHSFLIRREVAERIKFNKDRVNSKGDCYHFEHRGGNMTFLRQVQLMKHQVVQATKNISFPIWDTGHRAKHKLWKQYNESFVRELSNA